MRWYLPWRTTSWRPQWCLSINGRRPVVSSEIVNGLRSSAQWIEEMEYESWLSTAELQRDAADLIDAIDAQVAAYMNYSIGSSAAIQAISRLLTPWEARRER
jgi:hypothetical protein